MSAIGSAAIAFVYRDGHIVFATVVRDRFLATRGAAAEGHTIAAIVVFDVHVGPVLQQNNELGPWAARAGPRCWMSGPFIHRSGPRLL